MSENPCPCNLAAWPSATMNTNVLELPMYSAASNRKQEFTLRRSPRPGRRWNLQTSSRSEEHTSELQSPCNLVCRLLLEKKNQKHRNTKTAQLQSFALHVRRTHFSR